MKKLASIFLSLVFVFSFAASGNSTSSSQSSSASNTQQSAQSSAGGTSKAAAESSSESKRRCCKLGKRSWLTVNCKLQVKTRRNMKCQKRY